jgi:uroporphyrinogen-III decarboxylase
MVHNGSGPVTVYFTWIIIFTRPQAAFFKENKMTGKERLLAAIRGEEVDRVPVWIHGFPIGEGLPDKGHFTKGWMAEKEYKELFEAKEKYTDAWKIWHLAGKGFRPYSEMDFTNRHMLVPPKYVHFEERQVTAELRYYEGRVDTPRKRLTFRSEVRRGEHQAWRVEHLAKSLDDLLALAEVPFSFDLKDVDFERYKSAYETTGERGIVSMFISDPLVTLSGAIDFDKFLLILLEEPKVMHELLQEMTSRTLKIIDAVFKNTKLDTLVIMGGSEQATPPLMSPRTFDEYIVPYSGQVIKHLKKYGILVHIHCHGRVQEALKKFIEMGADSVDPVEPPPQGDVTYAEAREIVGEGLTLIGNIECSELQNESPVYIRNRVKEILKLGKKRLVITDSAPQLAAFTRKLADNYRVMIETALEYGG